MGYLRAASRRVRRWRSTSPLRQWRGTSVSGHYFTSMTARTPASVWGRAEFTLSNRPVFTRTNRQSATSASDTETARTGALRDTGQLSHRGMIEPRDALDSSAIGDARHRTCAAAGREPPGTSGGGAVPSAVRRSIHSLHRQAGARGCERVRGRPDVATAPGRRGKGVSGRPNVQCPAGSAHALLPMAPDIARDRAGNWSHPAPRAARLARRPQRLKLRVFQAGRCRGAVELLDGVHRRSLILMRIIRITTSNSRRPKK